MAGHPDKKEAIPELADLLRGRTRTAPAPGRPWTRKRASKGPQRDLVIVRSPQAVAGLATTWNKETIVCWAAVVEPIAGYN